MPNSQDKEEKSSPESCIQNYWRENRKKNSREKIRVSLSSATSFSYKILSSVHISKINLSKVRFSLLNMLDSFNFRSFLLLFPLLFVFFWFGKFIFIFYLYSLEKSCNFSPDIYIQTRC